jgi:hypothetical protein
VQLRGQEASTGSSVALAAADWRAALERVYSGFTQSATALGEVTQVPTHVGAYSVQALDALGAEVRRWQRRHGRDRLRSAGCPGEHPAGQDRGQQPMGPMSANEVDLSRSTAWASGLVVPDRDELPTLTVEPVDWQAN